MSTGITVDQEDLVRMLWDVDVDDVTTCSHECVPRSKEAINPRWLLGCGAMDSARTRKALAMFALSAALFLSPVDLPSKTLLSGFARVAFSGIVGGIVRGG